MEKEISCNVSILTEKMRDKEVYIARCEELGISDFGDTPEEAIDNLKIAIRLLLEEEPSNKLKLLKEKSLMTTRIFL
jgi:predicted RNase H-like HicB family nuclease